jgi:RsiW-degrading membrane proteinase PrsW (M82 family)
MLALSSLIFAVVPIALYLWGVWAMDRYDREPLGLLLANFAWGAFGAIVLAIVFSILGSMLFGTDEQQDAIYVAPVVEEIIKGVFLLWTVRRRAFDNTTDGIVYGMAIGLGFGMTENFLYFLNAGTVGEWVLLVVVRTLFSAVMHAMATGIIGAVVGATKFDFRSFRWPLRLGGLVLAMFMHYYWNLSVTQGSALSTALGMMFIVLSLVVIVVVLQVALLSENRLILRELTEESEDGVIPTVHLAYLPYSSKRRIVGWLPPTIDKRHYVQLATRLAFRKAQLRSCDDRERDDYAAEVAELRGEIVALLRADSESAAARLF